MREEGEEIDDDDGGETGVGDEPDEVDEEKEREQHHGGGDDGVHGRLRADIVDQRRSAQRAGRRVGGEEASEQRAAAQRDELLVLIDLVPLLRSISSDPLPTSREKVLPIEIVITNAMAPIRTPCGMTRERWCQFGIVSGAKPACSSYSPM